jgi:hypothetical protein
LREAAHGPRVLGSIVRGVYRGVRGEREWEEGTDMGVIKSEGSYNLRREKINDYSNVSD